MEWQQIIGFHHVVRLGSFTRAAEATFRTQSALSQQIRALEEEMGCMLFERIGTRKLRLTAAGERFLRFSEGVLDARDLLVEELNEITGVGKGALSIAAPFTTLYHLLPPIVEEYTKRFPNVRLTILDRPQTSAIELLKNGEIDFGFALESSVPGDLQAFRWKMVETFLLIPRGHPLGREQKVTLERIAEYPLILPPKSAAHTGRARLDERLQKLGVDYRVVMESSNVELSMTYVEMGLGVSFAGVVSDLPSLKRYQLECVSLSHCFEPDYVAVVLRKRSSLPSYRREFLSILLGKEVDDPAGS
jgi:DNA-binding transcriptional LysR family regulator